jgi:outer membrane protein TolC
MKVRFHALPWSALSALALLVTACLAAEPTEPAEDAVAAARKAVAAGEEELKRVAELATKDEVPQVALDRAQLAVAEAQLGLARAEKDAESEKRALRSIVERREAILKRLTSAASLGLASRAELDGAERDRAAAAAELARAEGNRETLVVELTKCLSAQTTQLARLKKARQLGLCTGAEVRRSQEDTESVRRQLLEARPQTPTPKPQPKPKLPDEVF